MLRSYLSSAAALTRTEQLIGGIGLFGSVASIACLFDHKENIDAIAQSSSIDWTLLPWFMIVICVISLSILASQVSRYLVRMQKVLRVAFMINTISGMKAQIYGGIISGSVLSVKHLNTHLKDLLCQVSKVFRTYTDDDCAASIKLFLPENKKSKVVLVKTMARDTTSAPLRDLTDNNLQSYEYWRNTAFKECFKPKRNEINDQEYGYFMSNDLKNLEGYENANNEWKHLYNATLVACITLDDIPDDYNTVGFICIDNKKGGFDDDVCAQILICLGKELCQLFMIYFRMRQVEYEAKKEIKDAEG